MENVYETIDQRHQPARQAITSAGTRPACCMHRIQAHQQRRLPGDGDLHQVLDAPQSGSFQCRRDGVYVRRGKQWDCIIHCAKSAFVNNQRKASDHDDLQRTHLPRDATRIGGIEADSHEAAASIARDKPTDQADSIDDCEGETLAALVDVAGRRGIRAIPAHRLRARTATQGRPEIARGLEGFAGRPAKRPGFPMCPLRT